MEYTDDDDFAGDALEQAQYDGLYEDFAEYTMIPDTEDDSDIASMSES